MKDLCVYINREEKEKIFGLIIKSNIDFVIDISPLLNQRDKIIKSIINKNTKLYQRKTKEVRKHILSKTPQT